MRLLLLTLLSLVTLKQAVQINRSKSASSFLLNEKEMNERYAQAGAGIDEASMFIRTTQQAERCPCNSSC